MNYYVYTTGSFKPSSKDKVWSIGKYEEDGETITKYKAIQTEQILSSSNLTLIGDLQTFQAWQREHYDKVDFLNI